MSNKDVACNNTAKTVHHRIFAVSDIHVDYDENRDWVAALSLTKYQEDTLLLAGDVSSDLDQIEQTLAALRSRFAHVFFVPGNHDLWLRSPEEVDSMAKFRVISDCCARLGIHTRPLKVGDGQIASGSVWVVPLQSWYMRRAEGEGSLYVMKPTEDNSRCIWADTHYIRWPGIALSSTAAVEFLAMNEADVDRSFDAPIITFSHFLPRRELMFSSGKVEVQEAPHPMDSHPEFNFSEVAGCQGLDVQIRRLGAKIHVYGHQHRNRDLVIDGVRYVSHCLGYPRERELSQVDRLNTSPKLVWSSQT